MDPPARQTSNRLLLPSRLQMSLIPGHLQPSEAADASCTHPAHLKPRGVKVGLPTAPLEPGSHPHIPHQRPVRGSGAGKQSRLPRRYQGVTPLPPADFSTPSSSFPKAGCLFSFTPPPSRLWSLRFLSLSSFASFISSPPWPSPVPTVSGWPPSSSSFPGLDVSPPVVRAASPVAPSLHLTPRPTPAALLRCTGKGLSSTAPMHNAGRAPVPRQMETGPRVLCKS